MISWKLRFCSFSISGVSSNQILTTYIAKCLGFASVYSRHMKAVSATLGDKAHDTACVSVLVQ